MTLSERLTYYHYPSNEFLLLVVNFYANVGLGYNAVLGHLINIWMYHTLTHTKSKDRLTPMAT